MEKHEENDDGPPPLFQSNRQTMYRNANTNGPILKDTIWTTMLAKLLLLGRRPYSTVDNSTIATNTTQKTHRNELAMQFVLVLCETILHMDRVSSTMQKFINGIMPMVLISLRQFEQSYAFMQSRNFLISSKQNHHDFSYIPLTTETKAIHSTLLKGIIQTSTNNECSFISSTTSITNHAVSYDPLMMLTASLIKWTIRTRIIELQTFSGTLIGSKFKTEPLDIVGLFLGAPESKVWQKLNVHNLEKQSMDLLKAVHRKNKTILRAAIRTDRRILVTPNFNISLRAFLCYQQWRSDPNAYAFLKEISKDILSHPIVQ